MELANSRVVNDEQTTQNRARSAIEAYTAKSDQGISSGPIPVSHPRHLDVDEVLARSLAKVVSE